METGVLRCWTLHIRPLNEEERITFERERPYCMPAVITGEVVIDYDRRFSPGDWMMTNLVCAFDLQSMTVWTASGSVYKLRGRGDIRQKGIPTDGAQAVEETRLRLAGILSDLGAEPAAQCNHQGDETCH